MMLFLQGLELLNNGISCEDELPEDTQEILMKNEDWENEYYPEGVRSGGWYNLLIASIHHFGMIIKKSL